jgi:Cytochrome c7 and related cytochrome c
MPRVFGPKFNLIAQVSLIAVILGAGMALWAMDTIQKSPYVTEVEWIPSQPVPFTHQHHVTGLGIDCRYCHTSVEKSHFAGVPPTSTCMNCHSQIWTDAPMLEPVRESYRTGKPIEWTRVHDLPDFVYFNHSIHVAKGVGCTTCHGPIGDMPLTWKANDLYMSWCLNCHKHPEGYLREDKKDVYNSRWESPANQSKLGPELKAQRQVDVNIHCSTCHR